MSLGTTGLLAEAAGLQCSPNIGFPGSFD